VIEDWLGARRQKERPPSAQRVLLLAFPRMFGYGFNPLSTFA
jgi:hypothetical protein